MMMKIFVAGASGFLGGAVANELARRGHEVIALDNELKKYGEEAYLEEAIPEKEGPVKKGELEERDKASDGEGEPSVETASMPGTIRYFYGNLSDERLEWEIKNCDSIISLTRPFGEEEDIPDDGISRYWKRHAGDVTTLLEKAAGGKAKTAIITYHSLCMGDRRGAAVGEVDALDRRPLEGSFEAIARAGRDADIRLVSLYPSMVYGREGWFRKLVNNIVNGSAGIVEPGDNYLSLLHIDDLAGLYAEIAERVDEDAMYVLSDKMPVKQKDMIAEIADLLGAPVPRTVDFETYASKFGRLEAESMGASIRLSAGKVVEDTGYIFKYPDYKAGIPQVLKAMGYVMAGRELKRAA